MVRIAGIDLPKKKKINFGLTSIYGIGLTTANKILSSLEIDCNLRVDELDDAQISKIRQILEDSFQIEGDLRRIKSQSIKRLIEISCYRGRRHIQNLPVRGQRTRTNARTKRGTKKTVAKKKKINANMSRKTKKKNKLKVLMGIIHVHCSFNNTIITITDLSGNTISWASAGVEGFKGARKATPFAAQRATTKAALAAMEYGLRRVEIIFRGQGSARETAVRAVQSLGLEVMSIKDLTPIPYNGCRAPKPRRI